MSSDLEKLRREIDSIDRAILSDLSKRMMTVKKIASIKHREKMPALDPARRDALLTTRVTQAASLKLPQGLARDIFTVIHRYSIKLQQKKS